METNIKASHTYFATDRKIKTVKQKGFIRTNIQGYAQNGYPQNLPLFYDRSKFFFVFKYSFGFIVKFVVFCATIFAEIVKITR